MRLIDCFIRMIAYVALLVRTDPSKQPDFETARENIDHMIEEREKCVGEGSITYADYDAARFAVFAWIDETMLNSKWEGRHQWQRHLLQRQYYQPADAGEIFFDRLNQVGLHQRDIREVYFICLAMGFVGQYGNESDAVLLEGLKSENLKILTGSSVGVPTLKNQVLFPDAYPPAPEAAPAAAKRRFSTTTLLWLAAPVAVYGVLFVIYQFVLNNVGESYIRVVS